MNICLFTPSFLPVVGGMEITIDQLARQFGNTGHKPVVIAQLPRHGQKTIDLPYEAVYYPRPRSAVWLLGHAKKVLLNEHRRCHFDVIHAHMAYPNGYIAVKLRDILNVPVVITSHKGDIWPESRYRKRFIICRRMCWAMTKADAVTGVSGVLKDIIDEMTLNKANSLVIPNGVVMPDDSPGVMPDSCRPITGRPFMLTLGRLHRSKGLDILLQSISILRQRGADFPHLLIAGDGRELDNLRQLAVELKVESKVIFAGAVFGPQKQWLLRNCSFLLQPSRAEGMPLTVLEAFAYGKIVIGTRISGTVELVTPGKTGYLVEPDDSGALADAILDASANPAAGDMGAEAARFAATMSWPAISARYIELYNSLR
jgi:teichuronic acid biosynthesis glycosyltransferase TuaC